MIDKIKSFLLKNNSTKQTIAKNTIWLFLGEIIGRLSRAFLVIYSARVLGAENWGAFSYAITFAAIFLIFSDIGINALLTRETAKDQKARLEFLSTAFFMKLALLFLSIGLIIFVAPLLTKINAAKTLFSLVGIILLFDCLREFGLALNRAMEKMENEALIRVLTNIATSILGIIFLYISATSRSLAFAYIAGNIIGFAAILWILRSYFKNLFTNFSVKLVRPIFYSAWPFALLGLLDALMINTDIIMLGWWTSASEIGFYSAVQRIIQFFYIIPALVGSATFPVFARLAKEQSDKFRLALEKSISLILLFGLPIIFGGVILAKETVLALFGTEYLPSVATFQIFLLSILFIFPGILITNAIFAYDKQKSFVGFTSFGLLSNIIFNYLLIPKYGIEGSAIATIISQLVSHTFILFKMKRINYFTILPHLKKIIFAAAIMAAFALTAKYVGINFWLNAIASACIYFGLLIIFRETILKEIKTIIY